MTVQVAQPYLNLLLQIVFFFHLMESADDQDRLRSWPDVACWLVSSPLTTPLSHGLSQVHVKSSLFIFIFTYLWQMLWPHHCGDESFPNWFPRKWMNFGLTNTFGNILFVFCLWTGVNPVRCGLSPTSSAHQYLLLMGYYWVPEQAGSAPSWHWSSSGNTSLYSFHSAGTECKFAEYRQQTRVTINIFVLEQRRAIHTQTYLYNSVHSYEWSSGGMQKKNQYIICYIYYI